MRRAVVLSAAKDLAVGRPHATGRCTARSFAALRTTVVFVLALLFAQSAFAVEPDEMLQDKALEARARAISAEIRCVVCQNQSIDDSNAEIARDMRRAIRERLMAIYGEAGAQIRILYGGSVKPDNAAELLAADEVGGALVGGASLTAESFLGIIVAAAELGES